MDVIAETNLQYCSDPRKFRTPIMDKRPLSESDPDGIEYHFQFYLFPSKDKITLSANDEKGTTNRIYQIRFLNTCIPCI